MSVFEAIVLGLVQGLSEFLPISSSGHLILARRVFGWNDQTHDVEKAFDVALHFGTFLAVVLYFRRDLVVYAREGVRAVTHRDEPVGPEGRLAWLLIVATIPAALAGALFEDVIDDRLGTPFVIAISLIGFGVLLWWADRTTGHREAADFRLRDAVLVGAAQALALNPGTSRSGITMTAARRLGFDRTAAVRLSFLMSLPVIAGAVVLKVGGLYADGLPAGFVTPMLIGVTTSFVSGLAAVWGTIALVRTQSLSPFVVYRVAIGLAVLVALAAGWSA